MTFFSSFFGVCRGLAAFKKVKDNSVFKTTVHLLLVLIFCSLAIGVGSYFILKNYYWKYTKIDFEENFGAGIQFTDRGVLPEKNADKNISQELPADGLLLYMPPGGNTEKFASNILENRRYVMVWSSACLALAIKDQGSWSVLSNKDDFSKPGMNYKLSDDNLLEMINEIAKMPPSDDWDIDDALGDFMNTDRLFHELRFLYSTMVVVGYFIKMLFLTLICSAIFTLLSSIFKTGTLNALTMWKVSIYAALPVLVVVSAFPMLHLPLMPYYGRLFVFGWVIYTGIALRYLNKYQDEPENKDDNRS